MQVEASERCGSHRGQGSELISLLLGLAANACSRQKQTGGDVGYHRPFSEWILRSSEVLDETAWNVAPLFLNGNRTFYVVDLWDSRYIQEASVGDGSDSNSCS